MGEFKSKSELRRVNVQAPEQVEKAYWELKEKLRLAEEALAGVAGIGVSGYEYEIWDRGNYLSFEEFEQRIDKARAALEKIRGRE